MTVNAAIESMPDALKVFGDDWNDPTVEDIFVVGPKHYFIRRAGVTTRVDAPGLDALTIEGIGIFAGHLRGQYADNDRPLMDCELPTNERLSMVLPPCVPPGKPSLAIRRASESLPDLEELDAGGLWDLVKGLEEKKSVNFFEEKKQIGKQLIKDGKITDFFRFCVQNRWSIAFVGETGSGKTFDLTAIILEIPADPSERIITVADTEEWAKLPHPNRVSFLYQKGGAITAEMLIEAALRNAPRWLFVQEIRDAAAFAYLRALIVSPGMSTWHARSVDNAFDALTLMVRQHDAGKSIPKEDLHRMMQNLIDVVVHVERDPITKKFRATDIKFGSDL